jgi:hypothetical protein
MISKTLKAVAIASLLMGTAITTAVAYPNTVYQAQIDVQLNNVISALRNHGFNLLVSNQRGQMYGRGSESNFYVNLQAGVQYRFEGRCDSDCRDLDMALRDVNGRELVADRDYDDIPGFTFTAPYTGAYVVTLELAHCAAYRCQVGAVVLTRSGGGTAPAANAQAAPAANGGGTAPTPSSGGTAPANNPIAPNSGRTNPASNGFAPSSGRTAQGI